MVQCSPESGHWHTRRRNFCFMLQQNFCNNLRSSIVAEESRNWKYNKINFKKTFVLFLIIYVHLLLLWFEDRNKCQSYKLLWYTNDWQFPPISPMQRKSVGKYDRIIIERVIIITCEWGLPHHNTGMGLARYPRQTGNISSSCLIEIYLLTSWPFLNFLYFFYHKRQRLADIKYK